MTIAASNKGRTEIGGKGDVGVSRPGKGVPKKEKQGKEMTTDVTKAKDDDSSSEGSESVSKSDKSKSDLKKSGDGKEKAKRAPFEVVGGNPESMMLMRNNTMTGDEAIAKSIAEKNGLGAGGLPSMKNGHLER